MSGHTPTPWHLNVHDNGPYVGNISSDLGKVGGIMQTRTVAVVLSYAGKDEAAANAALIVEAVNSHAALVAERDALRDEVASKEIELNSAAEAVIHWRGQADAMRKALGDELDSLLAWCSQNRHALGPCGGVDYTSGKESGLHLAQIEISKRIATLSPEHQREKAK